MHSRLTLLALLSGILLQGCATQYGCKGHPNDPICKSAVESYQATDGAKPLNPTTQTKETSFSPLQPAPSGQKTRLGVTEIAPKVDDPSVVRTAPMVMRLWIAPWEDTDGDLQAPSYVYTELEPRRWVIGKPVNNGPPTLKPLQIANRKSSVSPSPETLADPLQPTKPPTQKDQLTMEEPEYD